MTTTTATRLGPIFTELTTIHGFLRAVAGDLPDPGIISVYGNSPDSPSVHLHFDSLDDLREWAAYLQVPVKSHWAKSTQRVHHNASATWGPTHGKFVTFDMTHLEPKHVCSDDCDPGNCEVQHAEQSGIHNAIPRDCEAGEWS